DRGKRPLMGAIAARLADRVIVTDDNPRGEEPAAIRAEILIACPGAAEIGDRAEAIATAIAELEAGDVLLIAGKGHETGQTVGEHTRHFSDQEAVRAALAAPPADPLFTGGELAAALGVPVPEDVPAVPLAVRGVSIDSRTVSRGDLFVAIEGERL